MSFAVFILSTGRCGTQWIAKVLADRYGDQLEVEHEPLEDRYRPRQALAEAAEKNPSLSPEVRVHADAIERRIAVRPYLECGHPCWSSIPFLARRFAGRVRIVHLTRHPVPTCYSWLAHRAFRIPLAAHIPAKILLSPLDVGIEFKEYEAIWNGLTPFEKCLFYWAEIHAFGIRCQSRLGVPWLRLKYEDLFGGDGLKQLLAFLDLAPQENHPDDTSRLVDEYRYLTDDRTDWRITRNHPQVIRLATELGYRWDDVDEAALRRRYGAGWGD